MGDVLTDEQKPRVKTQLIPETLRLLTIYLQNL